MTHQHTTLARLRLTPVVMLIAVLLAACGASAPAEPDAGEDAAAEPAPATEPNDQVIAPSDSTPTAEEGASQPDTTGDGTTIALVLNGELGDQAFFDSAARGAAQAEEELGAEVQVIEAGLEAAGWEPALRSAVASEEYDLVITGTQPMAEILGPIAEEFAEQKFVFYDGVLEAPNVHSITYAQNEGSFLAGALAGLVTTSDMDGVNADSTIGFVGGLDLPVINDFLAGYSQGAAYVDDSVEVLTAYAGDFGDPARGLELASTQINQGADVVFQVAGGTGAGVFQAASDEGVYAIGVDSNQNALVPGTIITSMLKNVDTSLFNAMQRFTNGDLEFGITQVSDLESGGVGLATDEVYQDLIPADIRSRIDEIRDELLAGEITVDTTLGS